MLPLLTLLIPLTRLAPAAYRWQVRRRIYRWYRDLRELERRATSAGTPEAQAEIDEDLRRLERRVSGVKIPLGYAHELFELREHIRLVAGRLGREA